MVAERKSDLIEELRALLPNTPHARAVLERVRQELQPDQLFTTREAAVARLAKSHQAKRRRQQSRGPARAIHQ